MPSQTGSRSGYASSSNRGSGTPPPAFDDGPFDPTQAFKWSLAVYRSDPAKVVLPIVTVETIVLFVAMILPKIFGSVFGALLHVSATPGSNAVTYVQYLVGGLLGVVSTAYAASSLYPYLLNLARGRPVELAEAFRPAPQFPAAILLVAILMVAITLGSALCALPGIAAAILATTAMPALFDRDLDALAALQVSIRHTTENLVPILIFGLLSFVVTLVGVALCAVGAVLVSLPLVMLAQIYVYLRLEGEVPIGDDAT